MKLEVQWKKLSAEGIVIVSSILLAFAIDAWWETRNESVSEQTLLNDLRAELIENIEAIENNWLQAHLSSLQASVYIFRGLHGIDLKVAGNREVAAKIMAADSWEKGISSYYYSEVIEPLVDSTLMTESIERGVNPVWSLHFQPTYGPYLATIGALFQSGLVNRIQDPELRASLAALPRELEDYNTEEIALYDFVVEELRPTLMNSISNEAEFARYLAPIDGSVVSSEQVISRRTSALVEIASSERLAYVLGARMDLSFRVIRQLGVIKDRFEEILERTSEDIL
jgi:hypothetical protein